MSKLLNYFLIHNAEVEMGLGVSVAVTHFGNPDVTGNKHR